MRILGQPCEFNLVARSRLLAALPDAASEPLDAEAGKGERWSLDQGDKWASSAESTARRAHDIRGPMNLLFLRPKDIIS